MLSLALSVYFYVASKQEPELAYYANPVQAVVVKVGQASRLAVQFDGKPIGSDITTVQVAIWNGGSRAIKKDSILKPIVVSVSGGLPILEATIRKTTREVVGLSLQEGELAKGRLGVSWNILEHDDGAVIQIVYAGQPGAGVHLDGIIEGQSNITELKGYYYRHQGLHAPLIDVDDDGVIPPGRFRWWQSAILLVLLSVMAAVMVRNFIVKPIGAPPPPPPEPSLSPRASRAFIMSIAAFLFLAIVFLAVMVVLNRQEAFMPSPPFGFQ